MDPQHWKLVRSLFEQAVELPVDERARFLDQACEETPGLRGEVEDFLKTHNNLGRFLEPAEDLESKKQHTSNDLTGRTLGPYHVLQQVGEGGMGMVYSATRVYGQFRKVVAIKVARSGLWNEEILKRFERERETLARLEHPNIAGLLDAGATEDGLPYVVMEFVDGAPIDEYCDGKKLSTSERLKLFITICSAVQYAHQHLVIHRDIKPGNILVTADGTPKLLDFGIARILDAAHTAPPEELTRAGFRFVTPEYASPEQLLGENITTSSDVYSLGVLLFKLLTGHRPYNFKSQLPHEIAKTVWEKTPSKPSSAVSKVEERIAKDGSKTEVTIQVVSSQRNTTPEKLRRQLSGDLDTIILKAIQKEPSRRYATAEQFSEDVRRYVQGLPVHARRDTFGYRTSKFVSRHKIGVASAAVMFLLLIGGVLAVLWQAKKTRLEAEKVRELNQFMQGTFASGNPAASGKEPTIEDALDQAAARIDGELGEQPEIEAAALESMGDTYAGLGHYDKAERVLEKSLALRQNVPGSESREIASALHSLAFVAQRKGQYHRADSLYRISLAMHRKFVSSPDRKLVEILNDWGTSREEVSDIQSALPLIKEAIEVYRSVGGSNDRDYATLLMNYGSVLRQTHEYAAAEGVYREALDIRKRLPTQNPIDVAYVLNKLGMLLLDKGKLEEAESLCRQALAIRREAFTPDHPEAALGINQLALVLVREGKLDEAESLANEAMGIFQKSVSPDNVWLSGVYDLLGQIQSRKGHMAEAEKYLRMALNIRRHSLPSGHFLAAITQSRLGKVLTDQKKFEEAETMLLDACAALETAKGDSDAATADAVHNLQELYSVWKTKPK